MLRIFEKFKEEYIPGFIKMNIFYLVSQTYETAHDHFYDNKKANILLSDYPDKGYAEVHYNAVKNDTYASIINLKNEKHLQKLEEMIRPESAYSVYWAAVKDPAEIKRRLDSKYKDQIRKYIERETTWRIGRDERVQANLQVIFGELFIIIKRRRDILRIELKQLEKV